MNNDERINLIMAFEDGTIKEEDLIKLFQDLLNTGLVWKLQGCYGRMAKSLIDIGLIREGLK